MSFNKGDLVTFSAYWTVSGAYVNPTYVDLRVLSPGGVIYPYQYTPTGSSISNPATGKFQKDFFLAEEGQYWWYWFGSGTANGADEGFLVVDDSTF